MRMLMPMQDDTVVIGGTPGVPWSRMTIISLLCPVLGGQQTNVGARDVVRLGEGDLMRLAIVIFDVEDHGTYHNTAHRGAESFDLFQGWLEVTDEVVGAAQDGGRHTVIDLDGQ